VRCWRQKSIRVFIVQNLFHKQPVYGGGGDLNCMTWLRYEHGSKASPSDHDRCECILIVRAQIAGDVVTEQYGAQRWVLGVLWNSRVRVLKTLPSQLILYTPLSTAGDTAHTEVFGKLRSI